MEKKTKGAWLVHHTNKLGLVTDSADYGNLRLAGKCGIVLSALSATDDASLENHKVSALAKAAGVDPTFELPLVLGQLESRNLIERGNSGIEVLGLTTATVLEHAADIFSGLGAQAKEEASIALAEVCSLEPIERRELGEYIADQAKIDGATSARFLDEAKEIGFTDHETVDSSKELFFNGNLFRQEELKKADAILSALGPSERDLVKEIGQRLRAEGCVAQASVQEMLGKPLFSKLHAIGMFDVSVVSNSQEEVAFVTRPSAFGKFGNAAVDDSFDLAKALVASIQYGMTRSASGRGRITMVGTLLRKLINGSWVGPATAIGEDYRILELKNVIRLRQDRFAFSMKLVKREVGELALAVITTGDASEQSLPHFPGAAVTAFSPPETERAKTRKRVRRKDPQQLADLLQTVRTGRHLG